MAILLVCVCVCVCVCVRVRACVNPCQFDKFHWHDYLDNDLSYKSVFIFMLNKLACRCSYPEIAG